MVNVTKTPKRNINSKGRRILVEIARTEIDKNMSNQKTVFRTHDI